MARHVPQGGWRATNSFLDEGFGGCVDLTQLGLYRLAQELGEAFQGRFQNGAVRGVTES
jgi:hypothetical protein